eukprot:scaffold358_cov343-Pavlova_lutheri.AAC.15
MHLGERGGGCRFFLEGGVEFLRSSAQGGAQRCLHVRERTHWRTVVQLGERIPHFLRHCTHRGGHLGCFDVGTAVLPRQLQQPRRGVFVRLLPSRLGSFRRGPTRQGVVPGARAPRPRRTCAAHAHRSVRVRSPRQAQERGRGDGGATHPVRDDLLEWEMPNEDRSHHVGKLDPKDESTKEGPGTSIRKQGDHPDARCTRQTYIPIGTAEERCHRIWRDVLLCRIALDGPPETTAETLPIGLDQQGTVQVASGVAQEEDMSGDGGIQRRTHHATNPDPKAAKTGALRSSYQPTDSSRLLQLQIHSGTDGHERWDILSKPDTLVRKHQHSSALPFSFDPCPSGKVTIQVAAASCLPSASGQVVRKRLFNHEEGQKNVCGHHLQKQQCLFRVQACVRIDGPGPVRDAMPSGFHLLVQGLQDLDIALQARSELYLQEWGVL